MEVESDKDVHGACPVDRHGHTAHTRLRSERPALIRDTDTHPTAAQAQARGRGRRKTERISTCYHLTVTRDAVHEVRSLTLRGTPARAGNGVELRSPR
eukprot:5576477-Prymnesium_polylepis.1